MATRMSEVAARQFRALIVDDSQIARYILSCELERLGYQVEVAESAEAALRQIAEPLPDVIFMDHLLPGIDGLEAVNRLRGRPATSKLPIVMYTSQDSRDFAARARAIGADEIYVKTADESRLVEILEGINLLPERPAEEINSAKVTPIRRREKPQRDRRSSITRDQLAQLLEPSLEAHHARLRQELLGEFAIMERYEERMRRDLFARVETLTRQTDQRLEDAAQTERVDRRRRGRRTALLATACAASLLLVTMFGVRLAWDTAMQTNSLQRTTASTLRATQENAETLGALQQALARQVASAASGAATADGGQLTRMNDAYRVNAVALFADELQSMGIPGPIRVETSTGAFCIATTAAGPALVSVSGALQACEQLPMQLTVRNELP